MLCFRTESTCLRTDNRAPLFQKLLISPRIGLQGMHNGGGPLQRLVVKSIWIRLEPGDAVLTGHSEFVEYTLQGYIRAIEQLPHAAFCDPRKRDTVFPAVLQSGQIAYPCDTDRVRRPYTHGIQPRIVLRARVFRTVQAVYAKEGIGFEIGSLVKQIRGKVVVLRCGWCIHRLIHTVFISFPELSLCRFRFSIVHHRAIAVCCPGCVLWRNTRSIRFSPSFFFSTLLYYRVAGISSVFCLFHAIFSISFRANITEYIK